MPKSKLTTVLRARSTTCAKYLIIPPWKKKNGRLELTYAINEKLLAGIEKRDGFYPVVTNVYEQEYTTEELFLRTRRKYSVEQPMRHLKSKIKIRPVFLPRKVAKKMEVTGPNQHWQIDLKYGYITGTDRFFFQISVIDVFDRSIPAYHIGLGCLIVKEQRIFKHYCN